MDKVAAVHKRKKRYMAIILKAFEETVEEHVPPAQAEEFKGIVRQKLHAFALDTQEIISLRPGEEINDAALDLREAVGVHSTRRVSA